MEKLQQSHNYAKIGQAKGSRNLGPKTFKRN
ncbi:hypothetical protein F383_31126 [Gossypium arboreum]|uniref:Uncharacterized protein n=1 Tax=Gossypium arboreum TaxID=29729 RepID=A0A0B0N1B6_GOSAR|nr:hypothetical protein F383_31126 [Gossypium arboreum]